jgi:hypothetical protein
MAFVTHAVLTSAVLVFALAAGAARADCVDFSPQRAKAAGAALARNPPTAAQLGVPSLDGLELDGPRTTGDPKCSGPGPFKRFYYTSTISFADLVGRWYSNIAARTEADGMKRVWFRNPMHGDEFQMTSGTRVAFVFIGPHKDRKIALVNIMPAAQPAPLTVASQPYTAAEIVDWTPWPGGAKGPRQFVRADEEVGTAAPAGAPSAANPSPAAAAPTAPAAVPAATAGAPAASTSPSTVNCPPRQAQGGAAEGQRAGAEVGGAVLGGGWGRSLGAALGGALGSVTGGAQGTQRPAADPNCP